MQAMHPNVEGWNVTERLAAMHEASAAGRRAVERIIAKHKPLLIDWKHVPGREGMSREDYLIEEVWPDIDDAERAINQGRNQA